MANRKQQIRSHRPQIRNHRLHIFDHTNTHVPSHLTEHVDSYYWTFGKSNDIRQKGTPKKISGIRSLNKIMISREKAARPKQSGGACKFEKIMIFSKKKHIHKVRPHIQNRMNAHIPTHINAHFPIHGNALIQKLRGRPEILKNLVFFYDFMCLLYSFILFNIIFYDFYMILYGFYMIL